MSFPSKAAATSPIRVVIAEDQGMVLGALAALLALEPDILVVARAANGRRRSMQSNSTPLTSSSPTSRCLSAPVSKSPPS